MSDYLRVLLTLLAAANPAYVLLASGGRTRLGRRALMVGGLVAITVYVLISALASDALDSLDIEPETFRIASGIVMLTAGAWATIRFGPVESELEGSWRDGIVPLGIPLLLSPAGTVATVSYAVDRGVTVTVFAAATVVVLTVAFAAMARGRQLPAAGAVARLTGALLTVLAVGLIVDGVRAI